MQGTQSHDLMPSRNKLFQRKRPALITNHNLFKANIQFSFTWYHQQGKIHADCGNINFGDRMKLC